MIAILNRFAAAFGAALIFLGIFLPLSDRIAPTDGARLSDSVLASRSGADPSQKEESKINCGRTQAISENSATPAPSPAFVDSNLCDVSEVIPDTDPRRYRYKNLGSFCISCPVVGQSITVMGASAAGGYVKVGAVVCQQAPARGTKGTCDAQGHCTNTVPYDCTASMDFFQLQSGPGGGSGGSGGP